MSHKILFRRSRDELKHRFESMDKDPLLFCAVVLDMVDDNVLTIESITDKNVQYQLDNCALYRALQLFFSTTISTTGVLGFDKKLFIRFLDSILESALSILSHAEKQCMNKQQYRNYFCPPQTSQVECSISWIRGIFANAFLGNINRDPLRDKEYGGLNLHILFRGTKNQGISRVCCFIQYLMSSDPRISSPDVNVNSVNTYDNYMDLSNPSQRKVIFQRVSLSNEDFLRILQKSGDNGSKTDDLQDSSRSFENSVVVHDDTMEIGTADAFVNFANAKFGYGEFIQSCTQEEILQSCCPEMNVGMLFYNSMDNDTVILAHNVRRFSTYYGYQGSFRFRGPCDIGNYKDQTIITMDAVYRNHYTDEGNLRDTKKAYLGWKSMLDWHHKFSSEKGTCKITTGQWGCGAFGGIPTHKYLQQVIAAQLVNYNSDDEKVQLFFSSFNDTKMKEMLDRLRIRIPKTSPWEVYTSMLVGKGCESFMEHNIDKLAAHNRRVVIESKEDTDERSDGYCDMV